MSSEMGTFRIDVEIENPTNPDTRARVSNVLVDTGSELSWIPSSILESLGIRRNAVWQFRQANGTMLERWAGSAIVHVGGKRAADEVVFGEGSDMVLLGARSLEGLNLRVEPANRLLVDAGPAPAAVGI